MALRSSKGSKSITVEKEGYLCIKRNVSVLKPKEKSWQQKYVVLRKSFGDGTCLEWYEHFEAFIAHKNPTKLKLEGIDYIGPVDMGKEYTYAFILFGEGQNKLQMAAKTEAERSEWIKAINNCKQNGQKSNPTSPTMQRSSEKTGYPVKLKDYTCASSQELLLDSNQDFFMTVGPRSINLIADQKVMLKWSLENIKSYESRPLDQNPTQKLLSIDTGRRSSTGQGTFNFITAHSDLIKNQISLNTKRTYLEKMNSQDSFNIDNPYIASPEITRTLSTSPRCVSSFARRSTLSSREGPIPFHKYDPPSHRDSYATYVQHPDGYIDIFTDPQKVKENRWRNRSRSSVSTSKSPNFGDLSPRSRAEYIQVVPNEDELSSGYIHVLPEDNPDPSDHPYIEVIGEQESHSLYIEVLPDENSQDKKLAVSENHPAYIEVIEDEPISQSCNRGASGEEIYIDVDENLKRYESREQNFQSREQNFQSRERHSKSRTERVEKSFRSLEQHFVTRHESYTTSHQERNVTHELRQARESTASTPSPRWPHSVTSQTSNEFSSISSESDVFHDREVSIVPEVFADESTKSDDFPTESEETPMITDVAPTNSNGNGSETDDNSPQSKPTTLKTKPYLVASKSDTTPAKSKGLATNSDVNSNELSESRNGGSPEAGDRRSAKAQSWHSENEAGLAYNSGNSTSTSESEHTRDSHEFSDDENSDHSEVPTIEQDSPRDHSVQHEIRDRSLTTGDLNTLKANGNGAQLMMSEFEKSLTNPQQFTPNRHPPLRREMPYTQDVIIAQLENPIQGMSQFPETTKSRSTVKLKYICSNCGWHKRSKKRSSLRPSFRSKHCPTCNHLLTKQDAKSNKNKDKSTGGILHIIRRKTRYDEKNERKDPNIIKPERPSISPEPLFIKRVRDPQLLSRHSPGGDLKLRDLGIAPSPLTAMSAVSIDAGEPRGSRNHDESTSGGKSYLASSLGEGSMPNGVASPHKIVCATPSLNKISAGNNPLGRTASSPPLGGGSEAGSAQESQHFPEVPEVEKVTRKNSSLTLPTLPEVEDSTNSNHQTCHSPCTPPPTIPPRTRPPPVPPRRGSSPLAIPREENTHILRRTQTDPTFTSPSNTPKTKPKNRISRTLTDPGKDENLSDNNMRHAFSLGNLLEGGDQGLLMKVESLSLENGIESQPPPLPPRRGSGQTSQSQPPLPFRGASNENEKLLNSCDSPRLEPRSSKEGRRPLPERTPLPGSASPKLPLTSKRSSDAKHAFQTRKPQYSAHVGE